MLPATNSPSVYIPLQLGGCQKCPFIILLPSQVRLRCLYVYLFIKSYVCVYNIKTLDSKF